MRLAVMQELTSRLSRASRFLWFSTGAAFESEPGIMSDGWNTDETRIWPDEFAPPVGNRQGNPNEPTQEQPIRGLSVFHPWLNCRFQD